MDVLRGWIRASLQPATFLGLGMIALAWCAIEFHLETGRARSEAAAIQDNNNLARVFEEHIVRVIRANDRALRFLRTSLESGTFFFDFRRLVENSVAGSDMTQQLALIGPDGRLLATSVTSPVIPVDLSDREHFRVHLDVAEDGLFISKPVFGRVTGKWAIQLTRGVRDSTGKFLGVLVASIDPRQISTFYQTIDLGPDGAIALVGLDGVVRANMGYNSRMLGRSMIDNQLMRHIAASPTGSFLTSGVHDGVKRLLSYRRIEGYPLAVYVGRAQRDVYASYWRDRYSYRLLGTGLTILILIVMAISIRHRLSLDRARAKLRASEARALEKSRELKVTLDHMSQGLLMVDPDRNVAVINRRAVDLLGLPGDYFDQPRTFDELVKLQWATGEFGPDGSAAPPLVRDFIKAYSAEADVEVYERTRPNGIVLEIRSINLPGGGMVRTYTDVSDRKRSETEIAHMAHHDALTGLANRLLLHERIEEAAARLRRSGEPFVLMLLDLDRFKNVNDTLGHVAGDALLRVVAQRLRACVREADTVARLGGDEFAVLQTGATTRGDSIALAERIVHAISVPYDIQGKLLTLGASIGIAEATDDTADRGKLIINADLALYRVKSEGRNGYRFFAPEMDEAAQAHRQLDFDLRQALARNEFEMHYQPIYDIGGSDITSAEALIRWRHPQKGLISPGEFIPLAEDIGLMATLDAWVLHSACREAMTWPEDTRVAVNISPAKFKANNLVEAVRDALSASGLAPHRLELEISERVLLHEGHENIMVLHNLQALGVRIALDDFGTGYSSMSSLSAFRFDSIKIDQGFVSQILERQDCAAIVSAVAGLGRNLGMVTVAEGVEKTAQMELLRAAGCDYVQGFLLSRPLPAAELALRFRAEKHLAVA